MSIMEVVATGTASLMVERLRARAGCRKRELSRMIVERDSVSDRDRKSGPVSKVVGLYQMFLRRSLEH